MAINKVKDNQNNILLDLSQDTVDAQHLTAGYTAHNRNGIQITGVAGKTSRDGVFFYDNWGTLVFKATKEEFLALGQMPEIKLLSGYVPKSEPYNMSAANLGFVLTYSDEWPLTYAEIVEALSYQDCVAICPKLTWLTNSAFSPQDSIILLRTDSSYYPSYKINDIRFYYRQTDAKSFTIDWGDGTVEESGTIVNQSTFLYHRYSTMPTSSGKNWFVKISVKPDCKLSETYFYCGQDSNSNPQAIAQSYGSQYLYTSNIQIGTGVTFYDTSRGMLYTWWSYEYYVYGGFENIIPVLKNSSLSLSNFCGTQGRCYWLDKTLLDVLIDNKSSVSLGESETFFCIDPRTKAIPIDSGNYVISTSYNFNSSSDKKNKIIAVPHNWTTTTGISFSSYNASSKNICLPNSFSPQHSYALSGIDLLWPEVEAYVKAGLPATATYCFSKNYELTYVKYPVIDDEEYEVPPQYLFNECYNIKDIEFEEGVKYISSGMFYNCPYVEYIKIPSSIVFVGNSAFHIQSESSDVISTDFIMEIEPNENRKWENSWLNTISGRKIKIYYKGTSNDFKTENWGSLDFTVALQFYNNIYVLDDNGDEEFEQNTYSKLDTTVFNYNLPIIDQTYMRADLSYLSGKIFNALEIDKNTKIISNQNGAYFICKNVYFNGSLNDWMQIRFTNTNYSSQTISSNDYSYYYCNPMWYAEHLYVLDEEGIEIFNNKTYTEVTEITITQNMVDDNGYIRRGAIHGYKGGIRKIIIPENTNIYGIRQYAIYANPSINYITFPESMTTIEQYACTTNGLVEVVLSKNINSIANYAFSDNYQLGRFVTNSYYFSGNNIISYCYKLYELENHSTSSYSKGNGLAKYAKQIITDSSQSKVIKGENNCYFYEDTSAGKYLYMYHTLTNKVIINNEQIDLNVSYPVCLDNNVEELTFSAPNSSYDNFGSIVLNYSYSVWHLTKININTSYNCIIDYTYYVPLCTALKGCYFNFYSNKYDFGKEYTFLPPDELIIDYRYSYYYHKFISPTTHVFPQSTIKMAYLNGMYTFSDHNFETLDLSGAAYYYIPDLSYSSTIKKLIIDVHSGFSIGNIYYSSIEDVDIHCSFNTITSISWSDLLGSTNRILYLKNITLPECITSISGSSTNSNYLYYKPALESITFRSTTPPVLGSAWNENHQYWQMRKNRFRIRVPQGSLATYTSATNWPDPDVIKYVEYDPATGEDIIPEENEGE